MKTTALSILAFQAGWFACVLGAAAGRPLVGPAVVALVALWHIAVERERARLLASVAGAALLGILLDGALATAGILSFPEDAAVGWPVPVWMIALWINFALILGSLDWLTPRRLLAAALGGAGGAVSYLAGARLGAVAFGPTLGLAIFIIAVEWAVAFVGLLRMRRLIYEV